MGTWLRNNSRQSFHKLQQSNPNGARPIWPRCFQQYSIFSFPIRNQSTLRQWWSRNIPTQSLQSLSIFCRHLNTTVEWCDCEQLRSILLQPRRFCGGWVWDWWGLVLRVHPDFFIGELCRFVWIGYLWFLGWWDCLEFWCNLAVFIQWRFSFFWRTCPKLVGWILLRNGKIAFEFAIRHYGGASARVFLPKARM